MTPTFVEDSPAASAAAIPAGASAVRTADPDQHFFVQTRSDEFNWVFGIAIGIFHAGALVAFFDFHWTSLIVFAALWILGQNVGIAMSYHRLLTHRGYITPKWMEYLLSACGTLSLQGGPLYWVAVHRLHHQLTDKPGDPHSPRDGAWWSHMGWILHGSLHNETKLLDRYAPDLAKDPVHMWLSRFHWVPVTLVGLGLLGAGTWAYNWKVGLSWVLWGIFLRVTVGMHVTWLVNSATHMWGSKRFPTRDDSRNLWWVALLTGGEGWHNNHHAHPVSASHGMTWYEVDFNYWGIKLLALFGLAKNIKIMRPEGDGVRTVVIH